MAFREVRHLDVFHAVDGIDGLTKSRSVNVAVMRKVRALVAVRRQRDSVLRDPMRARTEVRFINDMVDLKAREYVLAAR